MTESMTSYIQLDKRKPKVIRFKAAIEEFQDNWVVKGQFLRLQAFQGESSIKT
jgi:hypothetical protein